MVPRQYSPPIAYEEYHKLTADETVLSDAIRLAKRYLTEKSLPDSAFDLIDRTMAGKDNERPDW